MAEQYTLVTTARSPRARSKRLREQGMGSTVTSTVVTGSGTAGVGHTHDNLTALDEISTDKQGYQYLTQQRGVTDADTGETTVETVTAKVKAGYADEAYDLTDDSPAYGRFLRKDKDDTASGHLTLASGLTSRGAASLEEGMTVGTAGAYGMDSGGNIKAADIEAVTAQITSAVLDYLQSSDYDTVEQTGFGFYRKSGGRWLCIAPAISPYLLNSSATHSLSVIFAGKP